MASAVERGGARGCIYHVKWSSGRVFWFWSLNVSWQGAHAGRPPLAGGGCLKLGAYGRWWSGDRWGGWVGSVGESEVGTCQKLGAAWGGEACESLGHIPCPDYRAVHSNTPSTPTKRKASSSEADQPKMKRN